jgi:hypothetical protein
MLRQLDAITQIQDAALREGLDAVAHPTEYGWAGSLITAAVLLPLLGVGALITDFSHVIVARTDDAAWDRFDPPDALDTHPDPPPNER